MYGRLGPVGACLALLALLAATAPAAAGRERAAETVLSNERTFTRWAYVAHDRPIFRAPWSTSARVGSLHTYTEDGFPEVYLLLRARRGPAGREWVELRIPGRPNGRVGWVDRDALGAMHLTHELVVVDRARLRLMLFSAGRLLLSVPVGIGTAASPTPPGHFWIREVFRIADRSSGYYPYAFGTADYSTLTDWPGGGVVGIHGPYFAARSIPGRISHGCIRLRIADDAKLARYVTPGTPLLVR